ncbi:MAG: hypothetical protein H8D23_17595, partial [Candidatus Brocadiales bacterium]|nr:hypothetical protein [Candidatus Brocadiales bacterium]
DTDDANNPITDPNLKDSDNNPIPLSAAGIQMIEDYQLDALATAIATQVSAAVVAHINANAQVELLATVEELKSAVLTLMNTHIANIPVPMDGGSVLTIAMKAALPAHVTALTPKIPTDSIL